MSGVLIYPADGKDPVRVAPMDPREVKKVEVDATPWLKGDALGSFLWSTESPDDIAIGDGTLSTEVNTGETVTPPAPTEVGGVITAYFWNKGTALRGQDYRVTVSLRAGFRASDRSFVFELAER